MNKILTLAAVTNGTAVSFELIRRRLSSDARQAVRQFLSCVCVLLRRGRML